MSYVEYDDLGVVKIRCMNCGIPVAMRTYKKVALKGVPPKEINVMTVQPLDSFRKKKYNIGTHGYVEVMLCSECVNLSPDPEKMEKAIADGWKDTWRYEKKTKEEIKGLGKTLPVLEGTKKDKEQKKLKQRKRDKYGRFCKGGACVV